MLISPDEARAFGVMAVDREQRIVEARRVGDDALAAGLTREFVELTRSAHKLKANAKQR